MRKISILTAMCLAPGFGYAQSLCESNAANQSMIQPEYESLLCAYGAKPVDAAQDMVDTLQAQVDENGAARDAIRLEFNDVSDRTVKTDAKISSLIEESNVSTDDTILILAVSTYDSIKALQNEREALVNQHLDLQAQLADLEMTGDDLQNQLVIARADLAAATAVSAVQGQALDSLRDALTQTNVVATTICGSEPVVVVDACPAPEEITESSEQ